MESPIKPANFWNIKRLKETASSFSSKKEFREGEPGAYQKAHKLGILNKICSHM
jgi:hypothetical protein